MAQRSIEDRQDLLFYAARRIVGYAVAKAQKRGDLPSSPEWWQWDFSTPPKLTIDDGRITKELETLWKIGAANMRDIVAMRGKTYEEHIRERADEVAMRKLAAQTASEIYGVPIEDREMSMLTPNETAQAPMPPAGQRRDNETPDEDEDDA
jgi:hypothetical protein